MTLFKNPSRRLVKAVLWLAVLMLLWWVGRDLDFAALGNTLSRLTLQQVLILLVVNAAIFLLFTLRWWWILRAQGFSPPFLHLVRYRLTAFGVTYFTPGPQFGGEPYQVYALHKIESIPLSASISAVTLDKIAELLANFTFLLAGLVLILRYEFFPDLVDVPLLPVVAVLLGLPIIYLALLWSGRYPLETACRAIARKNPDRKTIQKLLDALASAEVELAAIWRGRPGLLLTALVFSALTWLALIFEYRLALQYLGLKLPWAATIGVLTGARLAFLLPFPGALGVLETSQVLAMQALGAGAAMGISLALLIRARDILFGGVGLLFGGAFSWAPLEIEPPHDRLVRVHDGND